MNCKGKVRYVIGDYEVTETNQLTTEKSQELVKYLQDWKKRVMQAAIDHYLSSNYPDQQFVQNCCKEVVNRK